MKYYLRDPARAIEGMQGLTLEQVGAYNLILDHIYCRDNILPDDDELIRAMLDVDPRVWRRLKRELIAAGKIRVTTDGRIDANGVTSTLLSANVRSTSARGAANVRWNNYRKAKENNGTAMLHSNASKSKSIYSEISTASETSDEAAVDDGENFGAPRPHSTIATGELAAVIRAKGWK